MTTTELRALVIELLQTISVSLPAKGGSTVYDMANRVDDSRSAATAYDPDELPRANVITPESQVNYGTLNRSRYLRDQRTVVGFAFLAASDPDLAAAADIIESACWRALWGDPRFLGLWQEFKSWSVRSGRDAEGDKRRGIVVIEFRGTFPLSVPEPSDMTTLREIRATLEPNGYQPGFTITAVGTPPAPPPEDPSP